MNKIIGLANTDIKDILAIRDGTIRFKGRFTLRCLNKDGSQAWESPLEFPNGPTNAGLTDLLSVYFAAGSRTTTWYMGLINSAGFSALAAADTIASHAGWSEYTGYSESTRPAWTPGAAAGQQIASSGFTNFTMTGAVTIKGAFIASDNTKGGAAGLLWATGNFPLALGFVASGQILQASYSASATGT